MHEDTSSLFKHRPLIVFKLIIYISCWFFNGELYCDYLITYASGKHKKHKHGKDLLAMLKAMVIMMLIMIMISA